MSLTARLNLFFLSALALVLASFSVALFVLARHHLHRQLDERLDSALNVLSAAVEHTPQGVEWEPSERLLVTHSNLSDHTIVWIVSDPEGQVVDSEGTPDTVQFASEVADHLHSTRASGQRVDWNHSRWQFRQIWVESVNPATTPPNEGDLEKKYSALGLTVGISLAPLQATLRNLSGVLAGLSATILLGGLIGGRMVCRRALRPVTIMARAAQEMDGTVLDQRLPIPVRGDELEDLARSFNGLLERVQVSNEQQRQFTGEASHQLRTPLAALLGQVEVALRRDRPVEEYRRVLESVHQQAERLQRILEALLFLARADAEAQAPQREMIDLADWASQHLEHWRGHARVSDLNVVAGSIQVNTNPVLLGELLDILLSNAFKYSSAGSLVILEIGEREGCAEISVTDEGCGIADKDLPHVFEPFFRSATIRLMGIEGVGLGLAIAKRIAIALGGTLCVSSRAGSGSCFTLKLPFEEKQA